MTDHDDGTLRWSNDVLEVGAGGRNVNQNQSHIFCPSHFQLTEYFLHVQMNQVIRTAVPLDGQPLIIAANPRTGHNVSACRWGELFPYFMS